MDGFTCGLSLSLWSILPFSCWKHRFVYPWFAVWFDAALQLCSFSHLFWVSGVHTYSKWILGPGSHLYKIDCWDSDRDCSESLYHSGKYCHLNYSKSSNQQSQNILIFIFLSTLSSILVVFIVQIFQFLKLILTPSDGLVNAIVLLTFNLFIASVQKYFRPRNTLIHFFKF